MIERSQFALNRIISPNMEMEAFFQLSRSLGLSKVELRNDLPERGIIDSVSPQRTMEMLDKYSLQVLSINALQRFNVDSLANETLEQLERLIDIARSIGCRAIVLCPDNNVEAGARLDKELYQSTLKALQRMGPIFADNGMQGYVEPLGFDSSSLRSVITAQKLIHDAKYSIYKIVIDTFHHFLGPDSLEQLESEYDVRFTGLIHISGVSQNLPVSQYRDEHRVLVQENDILGSRKQVEILHSLGYRGDISFEPFSPALHQATRQELRSALDESIAYLQSG